MWTREYCTTYVHIYIYILWCDTNPSHFIVGAFVLNFPFKRFHTKAQINNFINSPINHGCLCPFKSLRINSFFVYHRWQNRKYANFSIVCIHRPTYTFSASNWTILISFFFSVFFLFLLLYFSYFWRFLFIQRHFLAFVSFAFLSDSSTARAIKWIETTYSVNSKTTTKNQI